MYSSPASPASSAVPSARCGFPPGSSSPSVGFGAVLASPDSLASEWVGATSGRDAYRLMESVIALNNGGVFLNVGSAAMGALAEKPELLGRVLIIVGLAEGIAIYGLIVSILILNKIA